MKAYQMGMFALATTTLLSVMSGQAQAETQTGFRLDAIATSDETSTDYANPGTPSQDLSGNFLGLGAGYDHQVGPFVIGAGADVVFGSARGFVNDGNEIEEWGEVSQLSSLYLRAGVSLGALFLFGMGGVAQAEVSQGESCPDPATAPFGFCRPANGYAPFSLEETESVDGTFVGVGVQVSLAGNWSLRGEYRDYDFGETRYDLGPAANGLNLPPIDMTLDRTEARVALAYHF